MRVPPENPRLTTACEEICEIFKRMQFKADIKVFMPEMKIVVTAMRGVPKKTLAISLLEQCVDSLDLGNICRIQMYGKQEGSIAWVWRHRVKLSPRNKKIFPQDPVNTITPLPKPKNQAENIVAGVIGVWLFLLMLSQCDSGSIQYGGDSGCDSAKANVRREIDRQLNSGRKYMRREDIEDLDPYVRAVKVHCDQ